MPNAVLIAILGCGCFFTVGLVTGIWKYTRMITSPNAQAPVYVDICHRSALMYSFACLVLAEFARLSVWPSVVNTVAVAAAVTFFATAVANYAIHGWLNDTDNMLRRPHVLGKGTVHGKVVHRYVMALILGEFGGSSYSFQAPWRQCWPREPLMFRLRSIVITGGSTGLGFALADALAPLGARLTLVSRQADNLDLAARQLRRRHSYADIEVQALDVGDPEATRLAIETIARRCGRIDMLFNNAGVMREGRFETLAEDDFQSVMRTNFHGVVNVTRAALVHLRASRGHLVNIASVAGLTGTFGFTAYASAKHALVGFTECLSYELPPQGIKVHLVCPAEFETPMVAELDSYRTPENRRHTLAIPRTSLETVVADTLAGIRHGRYFIVPGRRARLAVLGLRLFPSVARRLGARLVANAQQEDPA
ncbi:SDR family NAD(P)-dependent oxidoreductase [Oleomonas cavernae]|uniref:SDR family NAD(P)-dependent oxidoreductase n=1 Tax=Oleomonas cavernae TaxID=2320859 RepID=UPI0018F4F7E3|nr:SDR family oxidoreductase [Oleomonas cavernae]